MNKLAFGLLALGLVSCGQEGVETSASTTKIVNGTIVPANSDVAAHTVGLVSRGNPYCTGVLIDSDLVVTAAHCIEGSSRVTISFGLGVDGSDVQEISGDAIANDDFDRNSIGRVSVGSDIGLVLLDEDAPFFASPVGIAGSGDYAVGDRVTLAGYGLLGYSGWWIFKSPIRNDGNRLRQTDTTISDLRGDLITYDTPNNGSNGSCNGDSGGPMYVERGGDLLLVGVTSYGPANCDQGTGVYTSVNYHRSWIGENVQ